MVTAYVFYLVAPSIPAALDRALKPLRTVLDNKYYMDWFNENVLSAGARLLGQGLVEGRRPGLDRRPAGQWSSHCAPHPVVGAVAGLVRLVQTGHLYWYALVMVLGIFGFLTWRLWPSIGGALGLLGR